MDRHETLKGAIAEAMAQLIEEGELRPHNPTVCRDSRGFYFGSALHGDDVIVDLQCGFGPYEPCSADDIQGCAENMAENFEKDMYDLGELDGDSSPLK